LRGAGATRGGTRRFLRAPDAPDVTFIKKSERIREIARAPITSSSIRRGAKVFK